MAEITGTVIASMEVAQMVGKQHSDLLKDIRRYSIQLVEGKISRNDFFKESTYVTENNRIAPCFMVTKKGCEFIAHKLTGQKGTEFTARYINRFHEMEKKIENPQPAGIPIGEVASYLKVIDRVAVRQDTVPYKIAQAFQAVSEQFGIRLPVDFVNIPEYEQMSLDLRKGGGVA